jgi:hypothetical protein
VPSPLAALLILPCSCVHRESEHQQERGCEWGQANPGGDLERVGREVVSEGGKENGAKDGHSKGGRELF